MDESQLSHISDEELLRKYQQADAQAFDELFARHKNKVFNYLLWRMRNRADAEEAVQKTFLRIHRYILKYDSTQSALGWIMTIAKNVATDGRSKHRMMSLEDLPPGETGTENEACLEARSALVEILRNLPEQERHLLERRLLHEDSFEEIGKEEGWSAVNTRQRISRLLRRLKNERPEVNY